MVPSSTFNEILKIIPNIVEKYFDQLTLPLQVGSIQLSPDLILTLALESYSTFEKNESVLKSHQIKLILKYSFPNLNTSTANLPKSIRRKKLEFRESAFNNCLSYSFVKLDLETFLEFAKQLNGSM